VDESVAETQPAVSATAIELDFDFPIHLYQEDSSLEGKTIQFSQAFAPGKPVVLVMWAGLCPTCRFELPSMQKAYLLYQDKATFLGLDIGSFTGLGSPGDGLDLLHDLGVTFPAGNTEATEIMQQYRIFGVPETLIFAPNGELVDRWTGIRSEEHLAERIESLI
jgi:thiol-disulfide isomerase/thioredoxin